MKRTMFNLFNVLVVLALLLPAGGMSVTAQEPRWPRPPGLYIATRRPR
jgi:hypothetical protein